MNRKEFLKMMPAGAAGLSLMLNGIPVSSFAASPVLGLLSRQAQATGRVLVVIQLNGGNDGLNTLLPLNRYSELSGARSNILIPESKALKLNGYADTALHPSMTGIQNLFNDGKANLIQGVSYPNPSFSHFRATDIWTSAGDSSQYLNTGWLGRYLAEQFDGFPTGYPNSTMPHPLAIQIGTGVSSVVQGPNVSMGMAISGIDSFYNIVNGSVDAAPNSYAGHELTFVRYIAQQTQQYTQVIQQAAQSANNLSAKYAATGVNSLSDQLRIVARLVAGGLTTPVYVVSLGSFDTHAGQVDASDHTVGTHATLLGKLSSAVEAFYDDLKLLKVEDRVAAMTFSEFGRRIISNASGGTDHGSAAPVMVFGTAVNPAILGANPTIPAGADKDDNLAMQHDFRGIYAAVLADWFQVPKAEMDQILLREFTPYSVFNAKNSVQDTTSSAGAFVGQNYPNPFVSETRIPVQAQSGAVDLEIVSLTGTVVRKQERVPVPAGGLLLIRRDGLSPGPYYYRIREGSRTETRQMMVTD